MPSFFRRLIRITAFALSLSAWGIDRVPTAQDALKTLRTCKLHRTEYAEPLAKVEKGMGIPEPVCSQPDENSVGPLGIHLGQISKKIFEAASPSESEMFDFTQELWLQSMRNLLIRRINTQARYSSGERASEIDVGKLLDEVCGTDTPKNRGIPFCQAASGMGANSVKSGGRSMSAIDWLKGEGERYVAVLRKNKATGLSTEGVLVDLKRRLKIVREAKRRLDAELPNLKKKLEEAKARQVQKEAEFREKVYNAPSIADERQVLGTHADALGTVSDAVVEAEKNLVAAKTRFDYTRSVAIDYGPGVLLQTRELRSVTESDEELPSPEGVLASINELKVTAAEEGLRLNTEMTWALGLSRVREKQVSPAWIEKMILRNPIAAGEVLARHPKYAELFCYFFQRMEGGLDIQDREIMTLHGVVWFTAAGEVASIGSRMFELSIPTLERIAIFRSINDAAYEFAFGASVGGDLSRLAAEPSERDEITNSILGGRGGTAADDEAYKARVLKERMQIVKDILVKSVPWGMKKMIKTPVFEKLLNKIHDPSVIHDIAELEAKFHRSARVHAQFQALAILCGTLHSGCGLVMSAFAHLPAKNSARIKAQLAILKDAQSRENFVEEVLMQHPDVVRAGPETPPGVADGIPSQYDEASVGT